MKVYWSNPFAVDLRALGVFRIAIACLIIVDLLVRLPDMIAFTSDAGVMSIAAVQSFSSSWRLSLYWLSGSPIWSGLLFLLSIFFALQLAVGSRTRLATIASLIMIVSLHNRNPLVLQGGDNLLLLLVFWGCFLPWGARYSLDATMTRHATAVKSVNNYFSVATVALVIQILSVYFFSALLKSGEAWTVTGEAIGNALNNSYFGYGLAPYWRDLDWLTVPLSHYVWWLEFLGPLIALLPIFFVPARTLAVLCFATMEVGFLLNMHIGLFPLISLASMLPLLPSRVWDVVLRRPALAQAPISMYFDKSCDFCEKTCYLLRGIFGLPDAHILPAQDDRVIGPILERENSWVVVDEHGARYLRWSALVFVVGRGQRFSAVSRLLAQFSSVGDRWYHWIGDHRRGFGRLTAIFMPWRQSPSRTDATYGMISGVMAGVFLVAVIWLNLASIPRWDRLHGYVTGLAPEAKVALPRALISVIQVLRLDQRWNMFAPMPTRSEPWLVMPGVLTDDTLVDMVTGKLGSPDARKPESFYQDLFVNYRWRKYLTRMTRASQLVRDDYGRWLCDTWGARRDMSDGVMPDEPLAAVMVYLVWENEATGELGARKALRYDCQQGSAIEAQVEARIMGVARQMALEAGVLD